jgi:putative ABC transport system ATP-binding protein
MGETIVHAVDQVSFAIPRGDFASLLGPSGSGKSTLLNLIAGLDRPTAGSIVVDGRDLATMSSEELAQYRRNTVGMIFQSFNLVPTMTLAENLELPMRFAEVDRAERAQRATELLARVGLAARADHRSPAANSSAEPSLAPS